MTAGMAGAAATFEIQFREVSHIEHVGSKKGQGVAKLLMVAIMLMVLGIFSAMIGRTKERRH